MDYFLNQISTKKIGEIAIVSPSSAAQTPFIRAVCSDVSVSQRHVIFGRRDFTPDLALFLYGISPDQDSFEFAWDLVAHKMIGFVLLFDWYDEQSFEMSKNILDLYSNRFEAPILLAADVRDRPYPVKRHIFQNGVSLEFHRILTFCSTNDKKSVRNVIVSLLNTVINSYS